MKLFLKAVIYGAGTVLGGLIVNELAEDFKDPNKMVNVKKVLSNIKDKFSKKTES